MVKIGGIVKQSFIDYPGKLSAVIFTQGCNFRCFYCHNPHLVIPELFRLNKVITVSETLAFLRTRKSWLEGVVISGGEPTIHHDLPEFLRAIKEIGYPVKLDTNGSEPEMLDHLIKKNLVDFVAMDIKALPEKKPYQNIIGEIPDTDLMQKIIKSVALLKYCKIKVEFRTTRLPWLHDDLNIGLIKKFIGGEKPYVINEFENRINIKNYYSS